MFIPLLMSYLEPLATRNMLADNPPGLAIDQCKIFYGGLHKTLEHFPVSCGHAQILFQFGPQLAKALGAQRKPT